MIYQELKRRLYRIYALLNNRNGYIGILGAFAEDGRENSCFNGKGRQRNLLPALSKTTVYLVSYAHGAKDTGRLIYIFYARLVFFCLVITIAITMMATANPICISMLFITGASVCMLNSTRFLISFTAFTYQ